MLSLQWSHLWSQLVFTLTSSVILTPTWYSSSFGPDLQILKVASSWEKVIFPQFSSLKNFHLPLTVIVQEWSSHILERQGQLEVVMNTCIGRPYLLQAWKCMVLKEVASLCTHVIFQKERAIWRRLTFDHQKSAQWKQTIMNNGH